MSFEVVKFDFYRSFRALYVCMFHMHCARNVKSCGCIHASFNEYIECILLLLITHSLFLSQCELLGRRTLVHRIPLARDTRRRLETSPSARVLAKSSVDWHDEHTYIHHRINIYVRTYRAQSEDHQPPRKNPDTQQHTNGKTKSTS